MWKNHLKVSLRNLAKNKTFNFINISGLAIGLASSIFIILYIVNEVNYDRFNEHGKHMYRTYIDGKMSGEILKGAWNSPAVGPTMYEEIPEIIKFCRFDFSYNDLIWTDPAVKQLENSIIYADSTLFEVFSFNLLEGDTETCLKEPHTILLTKTTADRYFPEGEAMGQAIYINGADNIYTITGVVEDAPKSSHLYFDFIISYCTQENSRNPGFLSNNMFTYFILDESADVALVEDKMNASLIEHIRPMLMQYLGISVEEFEASGNSYGLKFQELYDIHLNPDIDAPNEVGYRPLGNKNYLYIFGVIAFFILVIASINFMNLSTARSLSRAKEVSLRKVVGSTRKELIQQFLTESVILSFLSMLIALLLVGLLLPKFNQIASVSLGMNDLFNWYMFPTFILLTLFIGLLSGLYPSTVLASFKPIQALKGKTTTSNGSGKLRAVLVVLQFTISVVIIVGTLVIFWQFRYMQNKDVGFERENMIVMDRIWPMGNDKIETFKAELLKHNSIEAVSNSTAFLGIMNNNNGYKIKEKGNDESFLFITNYTDYDFMETYDLEFVDSESRFMSKDYGSDSSACIINEAAVRKYMIEDPLNTHIQWHDGDSLINLRVIGVMKDVHSGSIKDEIAPYIAFLKRNDWDWAGYLSVRTKPGEEHSQLALEHMENTWKEFTEDEPFQYIFLDEYYKSFYSEEKRTGIITLVFSILSIFIACLGLFGMTLYNTQRRTREIGIRKVLGATDNGILTMVGKGVLVSLIISVLIAWPLAWYMTRDWLNGFPYNIGFQPMLFLIAALLALVIAVFTVTLTAMKTARINPAEALHYE